MSLSVNLVSSAKIRNLNKKTRGRDKATDVLSYPIAGWEQGIMAVEIGDLFISENYIIKNSKQYNLRPKQYLELSIAHGTLHLLGLDHKTKKEKNKMLNFEQKILKQQ